MRRLLRTDKANGVRELDPREPVRVPLPLAADHERRRLHVLAESSGAASAGGRVVGAVACSMQLRVPVAANV